MAIHKVSIQASILLVLMNLSLYILYTNGTPLIDAPPSEQTACPRGWFKYEQFCVTKAQGASDRAVALYCDGFGGIGIKGLCIVRAHTGDSTIVDTSVSLEGESSYSTIPQESTDVFDNLTPTDDRLCPQGWTHYKSLCVYQPMRLEERCHNMNAVSFHGLCIKHANIGSIGNEDVRNIVREDKRICCCSNFKSPSNRYGC